MSLISQAKNFRDAFGAIAPPQELKDIAGLDPNKAGETGINTIINRAVELIFVIGAVAFVFMFLISAVQMIISGGDKESVGKARSRLNWALIGIVILALSFVIFRILGTITGFSFFELK